MSLIEEAIRRRKAQSGAQPSRRGSPPSTLARNAPSGGEGVPLGDPARQRHIDLDALRQAGLLPPASEERAIAHQFRSIKRPLIRRAFEDVPGDAQSDRARHSILVTSALPGDGKTFTSLNLALSLALERDHSVILVDGDIPKPHITELFGARDEPGLTDLLEDPARGVGSVILPTDVPGLCLLPVGHRISNATELLASAQMLHVIRELESLDPFGVVVLDSSPLLLTSESRVLASLFDQVVLVVKAGGTPQQAVMDAIRLVGDGPSVNLVLNQAAHVGNGDYYGYESGQRYGEGFREEHRS